MMTRNEIVSKLETIINKLEKELPPPEIKNGWTEDSREGMLKFFQLLHSDLTSGAEVANRTEYVTIPRGLDHWGITGGELFEEAAKISHAIKMLQ